MVDKTTTKNQKIISSTLECNKKGLLAFWRFALQYFVWMLANCFVLFSRPSWDKQKKGKKVELN